jgi:beta-glucosidase
MTLEEKFWQLFMIPGDLDDASYDYSHGIFGLQISPADSARDNTARRHAERVNAIQRYFVERTRLGIPIIPFDEALHGFVREGATAFRRPSPSRQRGIPHLWGESPARLRGRPDRAA